MNPLPRFTLARRRVWLGFAAMSSLSVAISSASPHVSTPTQTPGAPVSTNPKDPAYLRANERFDPANHSWATVAPMPTARVGFSIATGNNSIFVFGGNDSNNCTPIATVEAYDPATDTWGARASMPQPALRLTSAATIGAAIYVAGGQTGCSGAVATLQAYDFSTNTWQIKPPMTGGQRYGTGSAVINSILYVVGGFDSAGTALTRVEAFNPVAGTWTTKQQMNVARGAPMVAAFNGKIYAFGGQGTSGTLASIEEFDPNANGGVGAWTVKASTIPGPLRSGAGVAVLNNKIYLVSGQVQSADNPTTRVDVYDPVSDSWSVDTMLPTARLNSGAAVVNNRLYEIGGSLTAIAKVNQAFQHQITATNHPHGFNASPPLTGGLNFDFNTGLIFGKPTTPGDQFITVTAFNSNGSSAPKTIRISVDSPPPAGPEIISSSCVTGRAGQPFKFQVLTRNVTSEAKFAANGFPYVPGVGPELTIDANTGMISGTVSPDPMGNPRNFPVAITLTDGSTVRQALLLMTFVSDPAFPTITSPPNAILRKWQVFSYTFTSSGGLGFNYVGSDGLAGGALPPGLSYDAPSHTISGVYNPEPGPAQFRNWMLPNVVKKEPPASVIEGFTSAEGPVPFLPEVAMGDCGIAPLNFFEETTFATWEQVYFTPAQLGDPLIVGESADPNHNCMGNLLEYALNLDPTVPSVGGRPFAVIDGTYLSLVYTKVLAASDLTYSIEESTNLRSWVPVVPTNVILSDDGLIQTIKAQVPRSHAGPGGKLFLHLRVSH